MKPQPTKSIKCLGNQHGQSSIFRELIVWFSALAIIPLTLVAYISYQQARESLTVQTTEKLQQSSILIVQYVKNWFDYRIMDLVSQADSKTNLKLLQSLIEERNRVGGVHKKQ